MAGGQDHTLHDTGIGWAIILVVLFVLIWLFWLYFDTEIRDAVRWFRYGEMWVLGVISDIFGLNYNIIFNDQPVNWRQGFENTPRWTPQELKYEHLAYFTALTMQPMKLPIVGLLSLGALWSMMYGPRTFYRSKLGLEGLIHRQAENFPVIQPFVNFNPSTQPPRPPGSPVPAELPAFAEALGPEEWLAYNQIPVPDGKLDEAATAAAFRKQLGGRWKGAKALRPHQQILLAAFCLKAARKRADADDMLGRIALCWSFKDGLRLNKDRKLLREARAVLSNKDLAMKTLTECNKHAFVTTALLRALNFARAEGGVLAPAQFAWLRGYDRELWYPLNNMGRQAYHMEALGAMAHFKAERMTQRPIPVPKVEFAVETIRDYMGSQRARPIPQLDYSGSKKRGVKKAV